MKAWKISLIIITCVLIAAGISVGFILIFNKKDSSEKKWPTDYTTGGVENNSDALDFDFPNNNENDFSSFTGECQNDDLVKTLVDANAVYTSTSSGSEMTLSSNQIPKYNTNFDPSPFVTHPSAGDFTKTIVLKGKDLDGLPNSADRVNVSKPTFGDVGYIGRPHSNIPEFTHWGSSYKPLEVIKLDPMPTEAWDETPGNANYDYSGEFRFNLLYLIKEKANILKDWGSIHYKNNLSGYDGYDGGFDTIHERLNTDNYYAHTQPDNMANLSCSGDGGVYHYHGFKAGEVLNYSNRVIGYSEDGFAIMGQGTYIFKPTINDGRVTAYNTEDMKPAVSGYKIRDDMGYARNTNGFDLDRVDTGSGIPDLDMVPGWFHSDYEYDALTTLNNNMNNKYVLDEYNMGFTALKHRNGSYEIEKVYVCTHEYPYTIHTLYGGKETGANDGGNGGGGGNDGGGGNGGGGGNDGGGGNGTGGGNDGGGGNGGGGAVPGNPNNNGGGYGGY